MAWDDRAIEVEKGPDFTVRIRQPLPDDKSLTTDLLPSDAATLIKLLSECLAEQSAAYEAELRKWVSNG